MTGTTSAEPPRGRNEDELVRDGRLTSAAEGFFEALCNAAEQLSKFPNIITCPSELVALSAAIGAGTPDCGPLVIGQSIHNASVRVPVLCFAGLSPSTQNGKLFGSRTEFIHWYCRYSGEIKTGRNIKEMVYRALHFALSDPKGPAYLMAAREVLEEVRIFDLNSQSDGLTKCSSKWPESISNNKLSVLLCLVLFQNVELIGTSLLRAKQPLIIRGYLALPISVVEMVGSDMCIRSDHEAYLGVAVTTHPAVLEADLIMIHGCDVPWIPTDGEPRKVFSINATRRQLRDFLDKKNINPTDYVMEFNARAKHSQHWQRNLLSLETPSDDGTIRVPNLASRLRHHLPKDTVFVLEAVTNSGPLIHHLHLTKRVCSVGDGTYLFSQTESVYWIARRYKIPFLLIVLNNGGWNAPKVSALLVHKDGLSSTANRRGK
ncbi:hypothetical protein BDW75DRAFT_232749 [Aspergillus navahoensis]